MATRNRPSASAGTRATASRAASSPPKNGRSVFWRLCLSQSIGSAASIRSTGCLLVNSGLHRIERRGDDSDATAVGETRRELRRELDVLEPRADERLAARDDEQPVEVVDVAVRNEHRHRRARERLGRLGVGLERLAHAPLA